MSSLVVDADKCKRDGLCVSECPVGIIDLKDKKSLPELIAGGAEFCINCGHCVAVCPHGALSMESQQCQPLQRELMPNREQVNYFLRSRRSARVYKDKPVDREILTALLDVARYAPSAHNWQPVHWLVILERAELNRLSSLVIEWMRLMLSNNVPVASEMHFDRVIQVWESGIDRILRGAPHLLVAHGPSALPSAQSACTIALTYLELAAYSFGLGACWAGYLNAAANFYKPLQEALSLPEGHQCFGAMMVGHARNKYHRLPLRNEAKIEWR